MAIWADNLGNRPIMRDIMEPVRQTAASKTAPNRTPPVTSTFISSPAFGFDAVASSRPAPRQQTTVIPSNSRSLTIGVSPHTRDSPKVFLKNSARKSSPSRAGMTALRP